MEAGGGIPHPKSVIGGGRYTVGKKGSNGGTPLAEWRILGALCGRVWIRDKLKESRSHLLSAE